jgi:signal peptidase I
MISGFVNRRPWPAAIVGYCLSPVFGMLYLGQGRRAFVYLALAVLLVCLPFLVAHLGLLPISAETAVDLLTFAYGIAGAVHCYRLASRLGAQTPKVWFSRWYSLGALIASAVTLLVAGRLVLWQPFNVPAASMEPSLQVGDNFIASKLAYRFGDPERGDIAVFLSPEDNETAYVKRLVGLPGDRVQMKGGSLYLNGARVAREEVMPQPLRFRDNMGEVYREILPEGRSYLIREISDQRPLDDTGIYEVPPGRYFFLGDNRDNSLDSRTMIGTVPRENLIGRVSLILWNSAAQRLRLFDAD